MPHSECVSRYDSRYSSRARRDWKLCATSSSREWCRSDPGGPLVVRSPDGSYSLAGIASKGMGCDSHDDVAIFTNIAAVYDWLTDYVIV